MSVQNTEFICRCLDFDPRIRPLLMVIRYWAKNLMLNALTSYALVMMVFFYLQSVKVLLTIKQWQESMTAPMRLQVQGWQIGFCQNLDYLPKLKEDGQIYSMVDLILGFFEFYAEFPYEKYVICPYLGKPLLKDDVKKANLPEMEIYLNCMKRRDFEPLKITTLCVQDPFEMSRNVASNTGESNFCHIFKKQCKTSAEVMTRIMNSGSKKKGSLSDLFNIPRIAKLNKNEKRLLKQNGVRNQLLFKPDFEGRLKTENSNTKLRAREILELVKKLARLVLQTGLQMTVIELNSSNDLQNARTTPEPGDSKIIQLETEETNNKTEDDNKEINDDVQEEKTEAIDTPITQEIENNNDNSEATEPHAVVDVETATKDTGFKRAMSDSPEKVSSPRPADNQPKKMKLSQFEKLGKCPISQFQGISKFPVWQGRNVAISELAKVKTEEKCDLLGMESLITKKIIEKCSKTISNNNSNESTITNDNESANSTFLLTLKSICQHQTRQKRQFAVEFLFEQFYLEDKMPNSCSADCLQFLVDFVPSMCREILSSKDITDLEKYIESRLSNAPDDQQ